MAEVDYDDILLRYPFLKAVNPEINWQSGKIYRAITLKGTLKGDALKTAKTTVAQQLMEAATDQRKGTRQSLSLKNTINTRRSSQKRSPRDYHNIGSITITSN